MPGSFVSDQNNVTAEACRKIFIKEAGQFPPDEINESERFTRTIERLWANGGRLVYQGYVNDPRNTDNAWIETTAWQYHLPSADADMQLGIGTDGTSPIPHPASAHRNLMHWPTHTQASV